MKSSEILTACDQAVSAVANGVGAGVLVVLFVACSLRAAGSTNAATRHALWFGTLLLLAAMIPAQMWREWIAPTAPSAAILRVEPTLETLAPPLPSIQEERPTPPQVADEPLQNGLRTIQIGEAATGQLPAEPGSAWRGVLQRLWTRLLTLRPWEIDLRHTVPPLAGALLLVVWAAVAGTRLAILAWRLLGLQRIKTQSLPASAEFNELFGKLRTDLEVKRQVELRVSPSHHSALVLGFWHPVILLPSEPGPDLEAAGQMMAHELAHLRRGDDWANLLQRGLQAALFFHPAIGWVSKQLALEREIASDDFVLEHGGHPQRYARLLVNLAGRRHGRQLLLAPGVSTGKGQLQQRITMILNAQRNTSPRLAKAKLGLITSASALTALLILYAGPKLVLAQNAPAASIAASVDDNNSPRNDAPQIAQADAPAEAGPANILAGPKFKEPQAGNDDAPPPPPPRREPRPPRPAAVPRLPRLADAAGSNSGANIEERLDRLERMVKSLLAEQKHSHASFFDKESGDVPPGPKGQAFGNFNFDAKRETARAAEMEKRANRQAEKAMKMEEKLREKGPMQDGFQVQLQALQQARETLQREMQKLQRQIEQMQRDHEHMDKEKRRHEAEEREEKDEEPAHK